MLSRIGLICLGLVGAMSATAQSLPGIFVIGDSTASNVARRGWGDPFADYFDASKVTVHNRARAGRSSRTFITEGLWNQAIGIIKTGDTVLIQMSHNDGGPLDSGRARGTLPGLGEETKEITNPDGKQEVVHTFGWYMRKYIADIRAKGARPIVLSLTVRNIWKDGKVERGSGEYGKWSAAIAREQAVPFLDMTRIIADQYEKLGEEKVKAFFPEDHTHTTAEAADLNASLVVAALKTLPGNPFQVYFSVKGNAVDRSPALMQLSGAPAGPDAYMLPLPGDPRLPSLMLIGDSTVRNGRGDGSNGQWGWGEPLVDYFDASKINVVNRALGGLSSRTYLTLGHWERVLEMLKPGDFVMMQFGHNDGGAINDDSRARGSIKGVGEEREEIDNLLTKQHETVRSYGWYLRQFIAGARAKGAIPIMCSLVPRKTWQDGKIARNSGDYAGWAKQVAEQEKVVFVDLNEIVARQYDALGPVKVEALFGDERTHTSLEGAKLNASSVVGALKSMKHGLTAYLSVK
jgi:lysophospholipase L1-like esterase